MRRRQPKIKRRDRLKLHNIRLLYDYKTSGHPALQRISAAENLANKITVY